MTRPPLKLSKLSKFANTYLGIKLTDKQAETLDFVHSQRTAMSPLRKSLLLYGTAYIDSQTGEVLSLQDCQRQMEVEMGGGDG